VADVIVVGAGIAGVSCARALASAGVAVRVLDRGRRVGGRMAVRTVEGRPVDAGAAYFTARDPAFVAVVEDWRDAGLARPWTDTFRVGGPDGLEGTTTGPVRWAAPGGLRSLVEQLADGLRVEHPYDVERVTAGPAVDGTPARAVVLAMPDPQAADLLGDDLPEARAAVAAVEWEPALALLAGWDERCWPDLDGVFVNDSPVLSFVADDGRRRGDGAAVLVAHSTPLLAAGHLDDPAAAAPAMLAELTAVLGVDAAPQWLQVRRWSLARPLRPRDTGYHLGSERVGLCGDGWLSPPRVEAAFLSGLRLAEALIPTLLPSRQ
jgi:predicted NAD/FAD-dependent oxidoreductase